MLKKFINETIIFAIIPQAPKIINIFLLPLMMPHLTSSDFGVYGLIIAYVGAASFFKDLGLYNTFFTSYYNFKSRFKLYWRKLFGVLTLWSVPYTILVGVILMEFLKGQNVNDTPLLLSLIILPFLLFENTILVGTIFFRVRKKTNLLAIVIGISSLASVTVSYIAIVYFSLGFVGWIIGTFISSLLSFLFFFNFVFLKEKITPVFTIKLSRLKSFLKISLPFIPHNYSSFLINTSDRIVLDLNNISVKEIGLYNFSYQIPQYYSAIDNAIGMVAFPYFMENHTQKKNLKNKKLFKFLFVVILSSTFLLSLWLKEIFLFFTEEPEYNKAFILAIFLMMAYNYRPFYMASTWHLFQQEKSKLILKISFFAGALNVILNLVFIPIFGIISAALITLVSYLYLGFSGFIIKGNKIPINYNYKRYFFTIIVATLMVFLLKEVSVNIKLILSTIIIITTIIQVIKFLKDNEKLARDMEQ